MMPPPQQAPEEAAWGPERGAEAGGDGKFLAVNLQFTLPPSAYATMLVRELTKESSSTAHHKSLNVAE